MSDKYKAIVHTKTGDMTKESTNITTPEMEHVVKSLVRETKSKKETRQLNKLHCVHLRLSLGQQPDLVQQRIFLMLIRQFYVQ